MRSVSIFGATGSIGQTTLSVLAKQDQPFDVAVLTGGENIRLLAQQAKQVNARRVVTANPKHLDALKHLLAGTKVDVSAGRAALLEAATTPVDWVMSAVVGFAGLEISLIAARACQTLALANKESLVCGGKLLRQACQEAGTQLMPVDSEHSAIFQCLNGECRQDIERVIITGSGGPFLDKSREDLRDVTPEQAADHPNWSMGQRISIDSATMFNKAMEIIEAKELFDLAPDQIEVLVHPQSIIHSMVGFTDGNLIAQLGPPDMSGAIAYALTHPNRRALDQKRLTAADFATMSFHPLDPKQFPAIDLAYRAMGQAGMAGAVFNAAKEHALDFFLAQKIGFLDMAGMVEQALIHYDASDWPKDMTLENIKLVDDNARKYLNGLLKQGVA